MEGDFAGLAIIAFLLLLRQIIVIWFFIVIIIFIIFITIKKYKFYQKAGEKGWKSLVPIYNKYVLVKIADINKKWFIMFLILPIYFVLVIIVGNIWNSYILNNQLIVPEQMMLYVYYTMNIMVNCFIIPIIIHIISTIKCINIVRKKTKNRP